MGLALYKKKRKFSKTTEPTGGKAAGEKLHFVVQKHDASHLHYDFRLEMKGVLKSWAVPKGPSMNPAVKRLAMMVEDHPYDYKDFEGIIPEGNYGAGTVIVWDEGTYEPVETSTTGKQAREKQLLSDLKKKRLKFTLHGKKLKGEFALVKSGFGEDNAWLLIKLQDKYASTDDVTLKDKSVISKRRIEQIEKANEKSAAKQVRSGKTARKTVTKKTITKTVKKNERPDSEIAKLLRKLPAADFPKPFKPMLATRVSEAFDGDDWLYEIKWDGYRTVAYLQGTKVALYSRNLLSFEKKFGAVLEALRKLKLKAVLDGEVVALDDNDQPSFQLLQNHEAVNTRFAFYVFDLPWYNGKDLTELALLERKKILRSVLPISHPVIRYSDHVIGQGKAFFKTAIKHGLEGVMAKQITSRYLKGYRSTEWLKIKNEQRLEAIICGFTEPRNSRNYFGAVILGKYAGNTLKYIGHSGSGFNQKTLKEMYAKFKPLITDKCPFKTVPKTNMPVTWLRPELVCEVKFTEFTGEKILRHPIFLGLREDKKAANEKNEKVVKAPVSKKTAAKKAPAAAKRRAAESATPSKKKNSGRIPGDTNEATIKVKQHTLKLTNLNKLYWPSEKITKRDLLRYYESIAPYIMPYLKNRPQSLNRHPDGIGKPNFFQKNMPDTIPGWIETFPYKSDADSQTTNYMVCKTEADLLYMASLGCIEINPWHSRVPKVDNPDWCVIDLDPDTNTFNKVIETALMVKQVLDSIGAESYCKTSGSTGLHIYIPLGAKYSYDQSRMLAQLVVQLVQRELPSFTSIERSPSKRKGKIYLDYLQNKTTQTIAAPYSLRPKPGAPVSTPLHWEELKPGLKTRDHNITNILQRVKETGDIFQPVLKKGIGLGKVLRRMQSFQ